MVRRVLALGLTLLLIAFPLATAQEEGAALSFEEALELARQSPEVQLASGQLELARKQLEIASSVISAELNSGYSQTWGGTSGSDVEPVSQHGGAFEPITLSATLNVVPYGPVADTIQRAAWQRDEAALGLRDAESGAVVSAAERYLVALRSQEELALKEAQVALAELQLEAARTRYEVGAVSESQLLEAELALSEAQNELADAIRQQAQALASLSNLLGAQVTAVAGEPPQAALPEGFDAEARLEVVTSVIAAELGVRQAELSYESGLRDYLPSAALSLNFMSSSETRSLRFGTSFDTRAFQPGVSLAFDPSYNAPSNFPAGGTSQSFSIGLSASIPLDTSMPPALEAARLNVEQSRMRALQARELATLEVNNRLRELEAAEAGDRLNREVVEARRMSVQTTEARLALGIATELDLRQAELNVQSAELAWRRSQDALLLSLMRLMQSLAYDPSEVF